MAATTLTSLNCSTSLSVNAANPQPFPPGFSVGGNPNPSFNYSDFNAIGTAASGQISKCAMGQLTITNSGTPTVITLSTGGTLTDIATNTVAFGTMGRVMVNNPSNSGQTLTLAPAASHGVSWGELPSAGILIKPGNTAIVNDVNVLMAVGASGTSDSIQVSTSGGTNVTCGFILLGR